MRCGFVVRCFDGRNEVIWTKRCVLAEDLAAKVLDFLVYGFNAFAQRPAPLPDLPMILASARVCQSASFPTWSESEAIGFGHTLRSQNLEQAAFWFSIIARAKANRRASPCSGTDLPTMTSKLDTASSKYQECHRECCGDILVKRANCRSRRWPLHRHRHSRTRGFPVARICRPTSWRLSDRGQAGRRHGHPSRRRF